MHRRMRGLGLGLALTALIGGGAVAGGAVLAQEGTPTPAVTLEKPTPANGTSSETTEESARNAFLDAFAAQLGVTDEATIDAAIAAALTQLVDEKVATGDLTEAEGEVLKERIAAGELPLRIGGPFGGHRHGVRDHHGAHGDKNRGSDRDDSTITDPSTAPGVDSTPAASTGLLA